MSEDEVPDSPIANPRSVGRITAARQRYDRARESVVASRSRFRTVDIAFHVTDRDLRTGGAVLAGAIAFRMFLWSLPAFLVVVGVLGFDTDNAKDHADDFGVGEAAAETVGQAAAQAHHARWVLVVGGLVLLVSVSRTLGATVRTSYALTWQLPIRRGPGYVQTAATTAVVMAGGFALVAGSSYLRKESFGLGLAVALFAVLVWTAAWWGVSTLLPHADPLPWWGLLPGALLVGVGAEIMHLVVLFYLTPQVTQSSALYGGLGVAATLLLGAYLIARLVLASAGLNATLHEHHPMPAETGAADAGPDGAAETGPDGAAETGPDSAADAAAEDDTAPPG